MRSDDFPWRACLVAAMAGAIFLTGCETTPDGGSAGTSASAAHPPADPISEGRRLYYGRCTACHAPEPVTDFSLSEWPGIIAEMGDEANLTAAQRKAVMAFVSSKF